MLSVTTLFAGYSIYLVPFLSLPPPTLSPSCSFPPPATSLIHSLSLPLSPPPTLSLLLLPLLLSHPPTLSLFLTPLSPDHSLSHFLPAPTSPPPTLSPSHSFPSCSFPPPTTYPTMTHSLPIPLAPPPIPLLQLGAVVTTFPFVLPYFSLLLAKDAEQVNKNIKKQCWNVWYEAYLLSSDKSSTGPNIPGTPALSSTARRSSSHFENAPIASAVLNSSGLRKSGKVYCYISKKVCMIQHVFPKS